MKMPVALVAAVSISLASNVTDAAESVAPSAATVIPLLTQSLPDIEGKEVNMLTVEFAPGGESGSHRHNANRFVYVLEGSVVMQVHGGKVQTLTVGQTFYESQTDVHTVSRNASAIQKAKILVLFVKDKGAPATLPAS